MSHPQDGGRDVRRSYDNLKPGTERRLKELQKLARRDKTFMALVDMYRYLDTDGEVVAHWYAHRDYVTYGGVEGHFDVLGPGYNERELQFLSARGIRRTITTGRNRS